MGWRRPICLVAVAAWLGAAIAAQAVDLELSVSADGTPLCGAIGSGVATCDVTGVPGTEVTVTWSFDAAEVINGYDLSVQWDPNELTLVGASQLFPDASPPGTIPFLVAPDPAAPEGSDAVTLSLVAFSTTDLFSLTFERAAALTPDCVADVSWRANGSGLAPATVALDNPDGAGVDLFIPTQCSDGIDNDGDDRIDFDGGVCAGAPQTTDPDPECISAAGNREKRAVGGCGLGGELLLVLPGLLARHRRRLCVD